MSVWNMNKSKKQLVEHIADLEMEIKLLKEDNTAPLIRGLKKKLEESDNEILKLKELTTNLHNKMKHERGHLEEVKSERRDLRQNEKIRELLVADLTIENKSLTELINTLKDDLAKMGTLSLKWSNQYTELKRENEKLKIKAILDTNRVKALYDTFCMVDATDEEMNHNTGDSDTDEELDLN